MNCTNYLEIHIQGILIYFQSQGSLAKVPGLAIWLNSFIKLKYLFQKYTIIPKCAYRCVWIYIYACATWLCCLVLQNCCLVQILSPEHKWTHIKRSTKTLVGLRKKNLNWGYSSMVKSAYLAWMKPWVKSPIPLFKKKEETLFNMTNYWNRYILSLACPII